MSLYITILFAGEQAPDDLVVIQAGSEKAPGLARLGQATLGRRDPGAPNAIPVLSGRGPKFAYATTEDLIFPPYTQTYRLEQT